MNKTSIWIVGVVVVLVLLLFWSVKSTGVDLAFKPDAIHPLDNVKGNASSTVIVLEYSDFQCPACRLYYPIMKELTVEFGDRVAFVYRHFPLTGIHPNAEFAARAAEAAGKQGKFWEMHDLLFEKQNEWSKVSDIKKMFESYAVLLGLSAEQFSLDWESKEVADFVRSQRMGAIKLGLQGTPSFLINGKQIQNPNSVEAFKALIREALGNK